VNDESHPKVAHETTGGKSGTSVTAGADNARKARYLPNHEPSAWLRRAAAKRVREIKNLHLDTSAYAAVIAPLGRTGPPGSRADRECDRCGRYVPERDLLHLFTYQPTPRIHLTGGLCAACQAREVG
jgi:hypothetical protein